MWLIITQVQNDIESSNLAIEWYYSPEGNKGGLLWFSSNFLGKVEQKYVSEKNID